MREAGLPSRARRFRLPGLALSIILVAVASSFFTYHPYPYDNVVSRWGLVRSLTEQGTIAIDRFAIDTSDRASSGAHFYTDKAVLLSLACVPVQYAALASGLASADTGPTGFRDPGRFVSERILVTGSLLLLLLSIRRLCALESVGSAPALAAAGLASIILPYSSILYAHVPAASLIFLSYLLQKQGRFVLSDLCGALASALEYPVLVLYLVLLAYRGRRFLFSTRALVPLVMLAAAFAPQIVHNWLAFGGPFRLGYSMETADAFEALGTGFFGFGLPSPARLFYLLFPPERGLFFYMPWAVPALAGLFARRLGGGLGRDPAAAMLVVFPVLFSALWTRTEGWAFGPRYLIPIVPFLAVGLARFASSGPRARWAAALLLIPATLEAFLGLLGEMHLPVHPFERAVPLPQVNISLAMLLHGHHSVWLLGSAGGLILFLAALCLEIRLFAGSRFSPAALAVPVYMAAAAVLSPGNWGGKIDFYRGLLAEHRQEFSLAAEYYTRAAADPTAPSWVAAAAADMRTLAGQDPGGRSP